MLQSESSEDSEDAPPSSEMHLLGANHQRACIAEASSKSDDLSAEELIEELQLLGATGSAAAGGSMTPKPAELRRRHYAALDINQMGVADEPDDGNCESNADEVMSSFPDQRLPRGWERHEDSRGAYYWHIQSGTIQRELPKADSSGNDDDGALAAPPLGSSNGGGAQQPQQQLRSKRQLGRGKPIRFPVASLGWIEVSESELNRSQLGAQVVEECINELNKGEIEHFGLERARGRDLFLDLYDDSICIVEPTDNRSLSWQPLHLIRIWGTAKPESNESSSDASHDYFAFIARDRYSSACYKCYVYQCGSARELSVALHDRCETFLRQYRAKHAAATGGGGLAGDSATDSRSHPERPKSLTTAQRTPRGVLQSPAPGAPPDIADFLTPMEEPKRPVRGFTFVGSCEVSEPSGVEILNDAIDRVIDRDCSTANWRDVVVEIAPSTIRIVLEDDGPTVIADCRVRYLSFLGIGRESARFCGFIMLQPDDSFLCFVLHGPDSAAVEQLCKTVEAACTLRYQKFLDAHSDDALLVSPTEMTTRKRRLGSATDNIESLGAKLKGILGWRTSS